MCGRVGGLCGGWGSVRTNAKDEGLRARNELV